MGVLLLNLVLGAAVLVSSLSGFGYALVAIPFMVVLSPPQEASPAVALSWMPLAAHVLPAHRPAAGGRLRRGAAGAYGLATMAPQTMRPAIGAIALVAARALFLKPPRPVRRRRLVGLGGVLAVVV